MSPEVAAVSSGGERARLLVIDDEPGILQMIKAVLGGAYALTVAGDGEEGLTLALSSPPDLILTDFDMPRMNGQQMLGRLRQQPRLEEVPVIVLSAHGDDQLRVDLLRNGAQDFLVKPFGVEELRVRIANLLRIKLTRDLLQKELQSRERDLGALVAEVASRRTALEAALESAREARNQAEKANAAKTVFLRLVSHELRSPLTVLQLALDRWQGREAGAAGVAGVAGGAAVSELQRVGGALDRLRSVVDAVIEYTTLQSTRIDPRPERTDLQLLLAGIERALGTEIAARGLRVELEVTASAREVTVDARILRLIVHNLLSNAIKFSDTGVIRVHASTTGSADGGLIVRVEDSGRGIDPLDLERIFEPFEFAESIENKSTRGVGLGLTLVRGLVGVLGGTVTVSSQKGAGSTFTVSLPQAAGVS